MSSLLPSDPLVPLLRQAVRALEDKKAGDLVVLHMNGKSNVTDFLVLATGTSDPHLRALRVELEKVLDAARIPIAGMDEGTYGSGWTVVDAYQIMFHFFTAEQRERYRMEELWKDALPLDLATLLTEPKPEKKPARAKRAGAAAAEDAAPAVATRVVKKVVKKKAAPAPASAPAPMVEELATAAARAVAPKKGVSKSKTTTAPAAPEVPSAKKVAVAPAPAAPAGAAAKKLAKTKLVPVPTPTAKKLVKASSTTATKTPAKKATVKKVAASNAQPTSPRRAKA